MKKITLTIMIMLSVALILSGCGGGSKSPATTSNGEKMQTVKSANTSLTLEVPESWKENAVASVAGSSISLISDKGDVALLVIEESAADLAADLTIDKYSDMLVQVMQETKDSSDWQVDGITDVKIGEGVDAKQRTISVTANGVNLKYLQTVFKTSDHFVEILEWTTPSKYDECLGIFNDILGTVKF